MKAFEISRHAREEMRRRGITPAAVEAVPSGSVGVYWTEYPNSAGGGGADFHVRQRISGQECGEFSKHFLQYSPGHLADSLRPSSAPVEAFQLIGENHSLDFASGGQRHFEGVVFALRCDWTEEGESDTPIVGCGREYQSRTPARLLVPALRIELEPDEIAPIWHIRLCYHTSSPRRGPVSVSA